MQAGGYRTGETLHFFAYDFRQRVLDLAPTLAAEIHRLSHAAGGPIEFREDNSGDVSGLHELTSLLETVLAGDGVDDK